MKEALMLYVGLVAGMVFCAIQAIRVARMLTAALWLACTSALLAALLYELGGHEIAVIELSVGAGLVTVLFVFALSLVGDDSAGLRSSVPWPLAAIAVLASLALLGWLALSGLRTESPVTPSAFPAFSTMLWEQRGLDVLVQIALIFAGVLGMLGLLVEAQSPVTPIKTVVPIPTPDEISEAEQIPHEAEREEEYA